MSLEQQTEKPSSKFEPAVNPVWGTMAGFFAGSFIAAPTRASGGFTRREFLQTFSGGVVGGIFGYSISFSVQKEVSVKK